MREELNRITEGIIGAAIAVHRELGPGLLESTYEACLAFELIERNFKVERQKALPVKYKDVMLYCGYRIDLLVEEKVIVELKAIERLEPIHQAQLLSHLKLSGCKVGLLTNFNVKILKSGIRRLSQRHRRIAFSAYSVGSAVQNKTIRI
ncbi:MAG: GxxExxY protein [Thermodesulfobacteriota bacterium]|nr:GxxExxY protein [Thermodesulfobacteriota bacterium]